VATVETQSERYSTMARLYHRRLCSLAYRILHDNAEAEDTVQQAHVLALSHLNQFAGRAALATWLSQIVVNESLGRRRRARVSFTELDEPNLRSTYRDPEQEASRRQLRQIILAAVQALPPQQRTVFYLHEFWELDTAETAARLGLTVECVKARLHRAKALLRKMLGPQLVKSTTPACCQASQALPALASA
jgi:RNA polymerase sigma-70 factor, ECF subfamily